MKKEIKKNTKNIILHSAIHEFIEFGYYGARMQRIAEKSNVNKAMIYYYYTGKEQIYDEVLRTILSKVLNELNSINYKETAIPEMIGKIIDVYQNTFLNYPDYIRLVQYELAKGGQNLKKLGIFKFSNIPFNPFTGKIYLFFKNKIKNHEMKKVNIFQLIFSIIGQVIMPFVAQPILETVLTKGPFKFNILFKKLIKERKQFIIDLIMEGIKIK